MVLGDGQRNLLLPSFRDGHADGHLIIRIMLLQIPHVEIPIRQTFQKRDRGLHISIRADCDVIRAKRARE